jgi:hypothetical protein
MDTERSRHEGRVPLPGPGEETQHARTARTDGIRRVRRMSNWTAAALVVGAGAATVALAHNAIPVSSAPSTATGGTTAGTGTTAATAPNGTSGPQVSHSVATTSGSGVVVTTTTHTVNGKVIVTHVRHAAAYHDN